jgi:uncharacterized protein
MKTILSAVLLCITSFLPLCAQPQQSGADTNQLTLLRALAEQGDAKSQLELGAAFSLGKFGVGQDYGEAVRWIRKAAEQNFAPAQNCLGVCYHDGLGLTINYEEAVKWFRKAAEQGDADAQCNLGTRYLRGEGVATNYGEAVWWYRKAAQQNLAEAQYNLGVCYRDGQGVEKDETEAYKLFSKAAEQNLAEAQCNLGNSYGNGRGVTRDYVEAYKWVLLAAAQGLSIAKERLPKVESMLTRGQLAEGQKRAGDFKPRKDSSSNALAAKTKANPPPELCAKAEAGEAQAQNGLGEAFYAGKLGVVKDAVEAVKWFRQAADQNLAAAQSNLGVCYERGDGVAKYEVEAYKWDLLAAAQGDTKAKRNLSMLELLLSPEELADGKRRAQAWLEQRKKSSTNSRSEP